MKIDPHSGGLRGTVQINQELRESKEERKERRQRGGIKINQIEKKVLLF